MKPKKTTESLPPAIFLMGPTASGKTGLAVNLRQQFPLELVSVDSALVYRGMDIGTAKPDPETLKLAPHRLIDIRDPSESYSAAEFRADALREMQDITASGRVPLLVGGTMLYYRALGEGLARLPAADPKLRQRLELEAQEMGWAAMHERLAGLDPQAADRIHPNDPQRIQRALEVIELSGRQLSVLQEEHRQQQGNACNYRILRLVVNPDDRKILHERIALRFELMLQQGFLDEVRSLQARGDLNPAMPSMRCVGYRQAWSHLQGEFGLEELRLKAVAATRQLAKRQLTWLRQESSALWYDLGLDAAPSRVVGDIASFLET